MKQKLVVHAIYPMTSDYAEKNLCDRDPRGHSIRCCFEEDCSDSRHHRVTCKACLKKLQKKKEKKS
jgi:hypothetical protein